MSVLIIDQLFNLIKKLKKIVGWSRDEEQDKDEKHIPRIPVILYTRPGTTAVGIEESGNNHQTIESNINQGVRFYAKATAATVKQEKISTRIIQKFAKRFKKGSSRRRSRGA